MKLNSIVVNKEARIKTGIKGFDRIMGGGLIRGEVILLGGKPGMGKSTLLIQVANHLAKCWSKVLYVSGEENLQQLKMRADRLKVFNPEIYCTEKTDIDEVLKEISEIKPKIIIVDSIQTVSSTASRYGVGSPSQTRDSFRALIAHAKSTGRIVIAIGHSNKSGQIAGLQTVQHMADVILYMLDDDYRRVYVEKNRFGKAQEEWLIELNERGIEDVETEDVGAEIETLPVEFEPCKLEKWLEKCVNFLSFGLFHY